MTLRHDLQVPVADTAIQQAPRVLDALYRAIESFDASAVRAALQPDVFVFTPTADGVLTSADAVARDVEGWSRAVVRRKATLQLRATRRTVGASPSGRGAWVFGDIVAEALSDRGALCTVPIRVTALLVSDDGWRVAAAYWSVPFPTQDDQDAVKHAGDLAPGNALNESVGEGAAELVAALRRAALAGPDVAWLAANIDIGSPPTPYRFLYIWVREDDAWQIVVSHDAVSRNPVTAGPGASQSV